jgi:hypothetical protein
MRRRLQGPGHDARQLDPFALQRQPCTGDARDVEQVVDEANHVPDLALDDLAFAFETGTPQVHQLKGRENRR